jgi:hypothetical protein
MNKTIVLTGPIGVGKSTLAGLLGADLMWPVCTYDEIKDKYRYKIGLSREKSLEINKNEGAYAMIQYMNEYKSQILEPIIRDHPNHIIDLGAGAHSFDKPHQIERAKNAFNLVNEVVLLMPSKDLEVNIKSLPGFKENWEINTYLIMHPTNNMFATKTIYVHGKTPNEVLDEAKKLF